MRPLKMTVHAEADISDPLNNFLAVTVSGYYDGHYYSWRGRVDRRKQPDEESAFAAAIHDLAAAMVAHPNGMKDGD